MLPGPWDLVGVLGSGVQGWLQGNSDLRVSGRRAVGFQGLGAGFRVHGQSCLPLTSKLGSWVVVKRERTGDRT